jgi:O-Antigen ligase
MTVLQASPEVLPARPARALRAWPVSGLLLLYPLWWALGLGVLVFFLAAVPMTVALVRWRAAGNPLRLPPGFVLWLLFLVTVLFGLFTLGADPVGTVPGTAASRAVSYGFRLGGYAALTVLLVYTGNVGERELPQRRLIRLLAWLFVVTVGGGLLGMAEPHFQFTSPIEWFVPGHLRSMGFVQSLVHPSAAQIMDLLASETPRPGAPWGYTNTWGNNVCLLVGFLVVAGWRRGTRALTLAALAVAVVPIVYSLNRGLWIGLAVIACYVAVRLARRGRYLALAGVVVAGTLLGAALAVTPLGGVVSARLDNGKSNGVRLYTTQRAIDGMLTSPVIGYGSTRNTQGGRNSIAVGESKNCERCGNFTIGGNGQLWQLLFAHGLLGTVTYLGFFAVALWRFRQDATPAGLAASAAIVSTFAAMLWYNSLVTPLALAFLGYAVLWRNSAGAR